MAESKSIKIPVILTKTRSGTPLALGVVTAAVLVESYVIPRRDFRSKTGYQREVSVARVNRLMKDLRSSQVDLPTSVLVNMRKYDPLANLEEKVDSRSLVLNPGDKLWIVDGQHRIEALARLVEEDRDKWGTLEIPFVTMLGASERDEVRQFYVVNSTAKSVRTDLALDLLKQRAESEPGVMDALVANGETWKVRAQQLVEEMDKNSALWHGRIRFPGEPTAQTIIGSSGLVTAVKQLLATPYFGSLQVTSQVKILSAYWEGIRQSIPEAFSEPSDYTIQKSMGVQTMHGLLISVLEYVRSAGWSVIEPESYLTVMADALTEVEGENGNAEVVRGADFWLAGAGGAAGSFSSNAGRRVLMSKFRTLLPSIEVE